jgi:hypothetical protein
MHSLGGDVKCVAIHPNERVVTDSAWSPIALGDNAEWAEAKVGIIREEAGGKKNPFHLVNHVNKLFLKKRDVLVGRLVGAPQHSFQFIVGSKEMCLW